MMRKSAVVLGMVLVCIFFLVTGLKAQVILKEDFEKYSEGETQLDGWRMVGDIAVVRTDRTKDSKKSLRMMKPDITGNEIVCIRRIDLPLKEEVGKGYLKISFYGMIKDKRRLFCTIRGNKGHDMAKVYYSDAGSLNYYCGDKTKGWQGYVVSSVSYLPGEWDFFEMFFDIGKKVFTIYANGNLIVKDAPWAAADSTEISTFILHLPKKSNTCAYFDDLTIETSPFQTSAVEAKKPKILWDRFGQWTAEDWQGKIKKEEELVLQGKNDLAWVKAYKPDPGLDNYGGIKGTKEKYNLKATGFFRVEKINDRWWFVTPQGNIFYSLGVCAFRPLNVAIVKYKDGSKGYEDDFEWLPPMEGKYAPAWGDRSYYNFIYFSFVTANVIRKYGEGWEDKWWEVNGCRLKEWGFNSLGPWWKYSFGQGDQVDRTPRPFPYVSLDRPVFYGKLTYGEGSMKNCQILYIPKKLGAPSDGMPDPFDPGFFPGIDEFARRWTEPHRNSPGLLGYIFCNEDDWGDDLVDRILLLPVDCASKKAFVSFLKERYSDDISKFNQAWGEKIKDFAYLDAHPQQLARAKTGEALKDKSDFLRLFADRYFKGVKEAIAKYDPNHLFMGTVFMGQEGTTCEEVLTALGRYADVICVNHYSDEIPPSFEKLHEWSGKPIYNAEFSFITTQRGFSADAHSLRRRFAVLSQEDRGKAYRNRVEEFASLPYTVGCAWYQFYDRIPAGATPGLNCAANWGIIDSADQPYEDCIKEMKKTNQRIYGIHSGELKPVKLKVNFQ